MSAGPPAASANVDNLGDTVKIVQVHGPYRRANRQGTAVFKAQVADGHPMMSLA